MSDDPSSSYPITSEDNHPEQGHHYIGPLTENRRLEKVRQYWRKKQNKSSSRRYHYICRQQVAERRLRIKGRFITRP